MTASGELFLTVEKWTLSLLGSLTHFSRQKNRHVTNLINLSSSAALEEKMHYFADERY